MSIPQTFPTRYLRCPSAVTVSVLKKFLVMKFAIPSTHQVKTKRIYRQLRIYQTQALRRWYHLNVFFFLRAWKMLYLFYLFINFATDKEKRTLQKLI